MTSRVTAPYLISASAAVLVGALVALLVDDLGNPPVGVSQAILIATCGGVIIFSGRSCLRAARSSGRWVHVGSLFLALGSMMAFLIPGMQLLAGSRESRLAQHGLLFGHETADVSRAYLVVAVTLVAFYLGELAAARLTERRKTRVSATRTDWNEKPTWFALLVLSAIAILLKVAHAESLQSTFAARGTVQGQGAVTVLGWAPALAVSLAVLQRHYHSRGAVAVSVCLLTFLVVSGTRSPLLLIFIALGLRFLAGLRTSRSTLRRSILACALVFVGATMLVSISAWRGDLIRGQQASLVKSTEEAATDPFGKLSGAGLDSLDGLVLAMHIDPHSVNAQWDDPFKSITGFVPHQLWPSKPPWLSNRVAKVYLQYGASGMFLSGAGYTWLIWGGVAGSVIAFMLLGFGSSLFLWRTGKAFGVGGLLIVYFLVRFMFGGDAFDGFHVLGLAGLMLFAMLLARLAQTVKP